MIRISAGLDVVLAAWFHGDGIAAHGLECELPAAHLGLPFQVAVIADEQRDFLELGDERGLIDHG